MGSFLKKTGHESICFIRLGSVYGDFPVPKPRSDRPRQPRMIEEQRAMPAQVCFPDTAFETNLYLIYMQLGVGGTEL